ncbi:MAG TPA: hypothetical protein VNA65_07145 [Candidatus Dormibacteraeota bacterium]|nr:hypothetical protein [Candidatus Dormibacteraeota bacterium]
MASGVVFAPGDFFVELRKELKRSLPVGLRDITTSRGPGRLMKIHYGEPAFHYEAWHHAGAGRFEVGLHFESTAKRNQEAFEFFRSRMVEVKASLARAELEPWDRGWSRLYETMPAARLDGEVLAAARSVLTSYISTLQPMLEQFLSA